MALEHLYWLIGAVGANLKAVDISGGGMDHVHCLGHAATVLQRLVNNCGHLQFIIMPRSEHDGFETAVWPQNRHRLVVDEHHQTLIQGAERFIEDDVGKTLVCDFWPERWPTRPVYWDDPDFSWTARRTYPEKCNCPLHTERRHVPFEEERFWCQESSFYS